MHTILKKNARPAKNSLEYYSAQEFRSSNSQLLEHDRQKVTGQMHISLIMGKSYPQSIKDRSPSQSSTNEDMPARMDSANQKE